MDSDVNILSNPISDRDLTGLEQSALYWLGDNWQPYSFLSKLSGQEWDVFNSLFLCGRAEMKIISPYITTGEGEKLYRGSRYEFRSQQPEREDGQS